MFDTTENSKHNIQYAGRLGFPGGKLAAGGERRKPGRPRLVGPSQAKRGNPYTCVVCKKTYLSWPSWVDRRPGGNCCSRACVSAAMFEAGARMPCKQCGAMMRLTGSALKKGVRFCDRVCGMRWHRGVEHFESYVAKTDGCWLWLGVINPRSGYGMFPTSGQTNAHRAAWTLFRGVIPADRWVLHKCENPPCVNPDHLFLGTPKDNTQDSMRKGRRPVAAVPTTLYLPTTCIVCGCEFKALAHALASGHAKSCSRRCHMRRLHMARSVAQQARKEASA